MKSQSKSVIKSVMLAGLTSLALSAPGAFAAANPCNPCSAKPQATKASANPCSAKNPCAAKKKTSAAKKANPCSAKNPCAAK